MRDLTDKQKELLEVLERQGIWAVEELSKELNVPKLRVRELVRSLRKRFLTGNNKTPYIFTTGKGYTLEEHPENVAYETRLRLQIGFGVLVNGMYVFKRCKIIAHKAFDGLNIAYKPKMLTVQKLIK